MAKGRAVSECLDRLPERLLSSTAGSRERANGQLFSLRQGGRRRRHFVAASPAPPGARTGALLSAQLPDAASRECEPARITANTMDHAAAPGVCLEEIPPLALSSRSPGPSKPVGAAVGGPSKPVGAAVGVTESMLPRSPSIPVGAALLSDGAIVCAVSSNNAGDGKGVLAAAEPSAVGAAVGTEMLPREPGEGAAVGGGRMGVVGVAVGVTIVVAMEGAGVAGAVDGAAVAGASVASTRVAVAASHVVKSSQPNWSSATHVSRSTSSAFSVLQPTESAVTHTSAYSSPHSSKSMPPMVKPASWRRSRQEEHSSLPRQEKMSMGQASTLENACPTSTQHAPKATAPKTAEHPAAIFRRGRRLVLLVFQPPPPACCVIVFFLFAFPPATSGRQERFHQGETERETGVEKSWG